MIKGDRKMSSEVDLDAVALTPAAVAAYCDFAERVARALSLGGIVSDAADLPDERAKVGGDGSLTVYVTLPEGKGEVSMTIPSGQWGWARRQ